MTESPVASDSAATMLRNSTTLWNLTTGIGHEKQNQEMTMKTRPLGRSNIDASVVGFGAWAIGGWTWGGADEQESIGADSRLSGRWRQLDRHGAGLRLWTP